jgi:hypothetical protein
MLSSGAACDTKLVPAPDFGAGDYQVNSNQPKSLTNQEAI